MNHKHLAEHLLYHLVRAQLGGHRLNLQELVDLVKVRRADVRSTLTVLHQQGLYDVMRRSLTLHGFAIAVKVDPAALPVLRPVKKAQAAAA
jgi:DNA-binding GntR family transcriptional regulator